MSENNVTKENKCVSSFSLFELFSRIFPFVKSNKEDKKPNVIVTEETVPEPALNDKQDKVPEAKSHLDVELKVEPEVEAKVEPEVEAKVEPEVEAKVEDKTEQDAELKAELKVELKAEVEVEPESNLVVKQEQVSNSEAELELFTAQEFIEPPQELEFLEKSVYIKNIEESAQEEQSQPLEEKRNFEDIIASIENKIQSFHQMKSSLHVQKAKEE
jgi:pilus assembly protein FimV